MKRTGPLIFATVLALGGCAVVPVDERSYGYGYDDDHYYTRETVIVTPAPRVEYRGYPPAAGYIWIDGYWNRLGERHVWVPGYWGPPHVQRRPIFRDRHDDRDREGDRKPRWRDDRGERGDNDHRYNRDRDRQHIDRSNRVPGARERSHLHDTPQRRDDGRPAMLQGLRANPPEDTTQPGSRQGIRRAEREERREEKDVQREAQRARDDNRDGRAALREWRQRQHQPNPD